MLKLYVGYIKTKIMKNHEVINPKIDIEYNSNVSNGVKLADSALPYMATRGYFGVVETISKKNLPEQIEATSVMLLSLPNSVASMRKDKVDPTIFSAMNSAMGELIDGAYGTSFTRSSIVNTCVRFAKNNGLVTSGDEIKQLEELLFSDLMGVWSEHSWENLLLASGVSVERATIDEDLMGTDLWVALPDNTGWVSLDIKAQPSTVHRHAANKSRQITEDMTIPVNEYDAPDFALYMAANSEGKSAYLAFSEPPSDGLAPLDFRGKQKSIDAAKQVADVLQYYAENNLIRVYDRVEDNNSVSFVPQKVQVT